MIELSTDQRRAADMAHRSLTSERQYCVIHGLAGTGKTTVLAKLASETEGARICAPTGKAASVIRGKTGLPAQTLHSLLYTPKEVMDEHGKEVLRFIPAFQTGDLKGLTVLVDECSMVPAEIANDLLRAGCHVIAFGDPGQLPPVKGEPFFSKPDHMLTEIHRQAAESPIIRQAYRVRQGLPYEGDGVDFQIVNIDDQDMVWADVVLCWKNQTRLEINRYMREARGIDPAARPRKGEPVVCLKNNPKMGVMNGETFIVAKDWDRGFLQLEGDISIPRPHFATLDAGKPAFMQNQFDFAYALTVHKAQGSEFDRVLIVDEHKRDGWDAWAYTGITRAAKSVRICRI